MFLKSILLYFRQIYEFIFYLLYLPYLNQAPLLEDKINDHNEIGQQVADQFKNEENQFTQQVVEQIWKDITSIPCGHHTILIDKYLGHPKKALFYVHQTVVNGWSRNVLLNFISTRLYERQGKALANFKRTFPSEDKR